MESAAENEQNKNNAGRTCCGETAPCLFESAGLSGPYQPPSPQDFCLAGTWFLRFLCFMIVSSLFSYGLPFIAAYGYAVSQSLQETSLGRFFLFFARYIS